MTASDTCPVCNGPNQCQANSDCWCLKQPHRHPMPSQATPCLCASCLAQQDKPINGVTYFEIPYALTEKKRSGVVTVFGKTREESIKIAKEYIEKSHPHPYIIDDDSISECKIVDGVCHNWWWSM